MLLVRVPLFFLYLHIVTVIAAPAGGKEKLVETVVSGVKGASKYKGLRPVSAIQRPTSPSRRPSFLVDKSSENFLLPKFYSTARLEAIKVELRTLEDPTKPLQVIAKDAFEQQNSENTSKARKRWRMDPECVAAAWYVARQAVVIGGSAMLAEMMPGSVVGGTQSLIGAWVGITAAAADEELGDKLRSMPESTAQRILKQNNIPYDEDMSPEKLIRFIDNLIEKGEAIKNDIDVWSKQADEKATETKSERTRRNGIESMVKRTSLQPRAMTLDSLCKNIVPRVKAFKDAQQSILEFSGVAKGMRGALISRIGVLATTCPIGWVVGAITKGVGEYVGGGKAGDMAAQKEEEEKKAAAKAKADALKEKESSRSDSGAETETETEGGRKKTSGLESRGLMKTIACVPVIGGLFAGAAIENGLADDFFVDMAIEKYGALVEILGPLLKEFTLYEPDEDNPLAILVPVLKNYDSEMKPI